MTPLTYYQQQVLSGQIVADRQQIEAMKAFEALFECLTRSTRFPLRFRSRVRKQKGIYLWGSIGAGKSYLMSCFYQQLPIEKKKRLHFHEFMERVHADMKKYQGKLNPVNHIAKAWAKQVRVLCLDEFMVTNIVDAVLLARLLQGLIRGGVCLVLTSNTPPHLLYLNGLQREQFLPAIDLIEAQTQIIHLENQQDYRYLKEKTSMNYYLCSTPHLKKILKERFDQYSTSGESLTEPLSILGRSVPVVMRSNNVVWFEFDAICGIPRSQLDFLKLVKQFEVVIVSDVPVFDSRDQDRLRTFIHFIDVLYDAKIHLILSANAPIHELYVSGRYLKEFERTQSRLVEMSMGFS